MNEIRELEAKHEKVRNDYAILYRMMKEKAQEAEELSQKLCLKQKCEKWKKWTQYWDRILLRSL